MGVWKMARWVFKRYHIRATMEFLLEFQMSMLVGVNLLREISWKSVP